MIFMRITIKKINFTLLFFLFAFSCIHAQDRSNYALLWEIQHKDDSKKSYVFGTMHLKDKRVFDFNDALLPAIKQSEVFALELNPETLGKDISRIDLINDFSSKYKEILDEEDYEKLRQKIKEKTGDELEDLYTNDLDYLESIFRPDIEKEDDKDIFLDLYLYQVAASLGKEIDGLEELKDQITDYSKTSDEELKNGVIDLLNYSDEEYREQLNKMIEVYVSGDLTRIDAFIKKYEGYDDILEKRNRVMVTSIKSITENKSLFAAIGAAHLPGDTGVINLLKEEGYTVKRVDNVFTGLSNDFIIKPNLDEWISYTDSLSGYTVNQPASVQKIELGEIEEEKAFVDLKSGSVFFHFGLDMRDKRKSTIESAPSNFVRNLITKDSTAVLSNKEVTHGDDIYKQIIIKGEGVNKVNHFELISKNGFFYAFGMEYNQDSNISIAENFFENISFQAPTLESSLWKPFLHKEGAFSVQMPGKITDNSRVTPNPDNPEGPPYEINMFFAQDIANEYNYIVRYNNFPIGYYLQNELEISEALIDQMEQSTGSKILHKKKSTYKGHVVYDFDIKIQEKFHSVIRYISRDNRTYVLLAQRTNEVDTASFDNPFFNSFEFTEYEPSTYKTIRDTDGNYSFLFPNAYRTETDTVVDYESYIGGAKTYYGLDKNTSSCYSISVSNFKKYFKITEDRLEVFFNEFAEAYNDYGDSIYKEKSFLDKEYPAKEYYVKSNRTSVLKRHKFILINNRLVILSAYLGEKEIESDTIERFFSSLTMKKQKNFDVYKSKSSLIMKDLRSKDSITRFEANGALDYYEFEASDKVLLEKGLSREYINDTTYYGTKNLLIYNLGLIGNNTTVSKLESFYKSKISNNHNKLMILEALTKIKSQEANEAYFNLIENNSLERIPNNYFPILNHEADSILPYSQYSNRIIPDRLEYYTPEIGKSVSDLIQNTNDNGWYILKAFEYYVQNTDLIDSQVIKSITDSLYYRFEAMQFLISTDNTSLIPKENLDQHNFAKLSLYNAIGDYYGYPNEIVFIDTIIVDAQEYLVYSCNYVIEEEDDESYLGVVKVGTIDFENFEQFTSYYSSDVLEEDWQNQTKKLLESVKNKE